MLAKLTTGLPKTCTYFPMKLLHYPFIYFLNVKEMSLKKLHFSLKKFHWKSFIISSYHFLLNFTLAANVLDVVVLEADSVHRQVSLHALRLLDDEAATE